MAWWKPRCKTDSILLTKQEPRHRCPGTDHSSPHHILPNAKRSIKRNSLSCKLSFRGGNPNLELRMKATRRHLRSPPSLLCGYTACWQLGAARRAGLSGSASRSAPSPLSRLKAQPLDGHFAPTAPARAALFKPNLQLRNSKSDGGTRLFGEAEKAEPWIPPAKQHNRYLLPYLTAR